MALELHNTFTIAMPVDQAWPLLNDVERIAPCVPGTKLTEMVDADTFKGEVSIKLGPIAVTFGGTATIESRDEATHTAVVKAQGNELKGRGGTAATVRCRLTPEGEVTRVDVDTAIELFGQVAQYGRAAGMITEAAGVLVDQFAECLSTRLAAADRPTPAADETAPALSLAWRAFRRWLKRIFAERGATQ